MRTAITPLGHIPGIVRSSVMVSLVLACALFLQSARPAEAATIAFEQQYFDLETGTVFDIEFDEPVPSDADFHFAFNGSGGNPVVLFQEYPAQIAFLAGVPFSASTPPAETLIFTQSLIDRRFNYGDTIVIKTMDGNLFKIGEPVWISTGFSNSVSFSYAPLRPAVACAVGTFSTTGNEPCTPAPAGSYVSTTGATSATQCPTGTFSSAPGAAQCTPAPAGSYVSTTGATSATQCPIGTFSSTTGATQCTPAPVDSYVATVGATAATACSPGTWTNGATGATQCATIPPSQQLANLSASIAQMGLDGGTAASLQTKLQSALKSSAPASCNQLTSFTNEVSAQSGKKLTVQQAADLTAAVTRIRSAAGCS